MLDLKFVRSNLDSVKNMIKNRAYKLDLQRFEELDRERRERLSVLEELRHQRNQVSDKIAAMKKKGEKVSVNLNEMKEASINIKKKEKEIAQFIEDLNQLLMVIPNMPHESVPVGSDENDNKVIRQWGEIRNMDFKPLSHSEIGEKLSILDFARATKIAGARFSILQGMGARIERALINFMLDILMMLMVWEFLIQPMVEVVLLLLLLLVEDIYWIKTIWE